MISLMVTKKFQFWKIISNIPLAKGNAESNEIYKGFTKGRKSIGCSDQTKMINDRFFRGPTKNQVIRFSFWPEPEFDIWRVYATSGHAQRSGEVCWSAEHPTGRDPRSIGRARLTLDPGEGLRHKPTGFCGRTKSGGTPRNKLIKFPFWNWNLEFKTEIVFNAAKKV